MESDYEIGKCTMTCILIPPIVFMIGFTIMLVIGIFVKGIIPDLYGWLVFLGALIGVPIIYFLTMIFPIIYGVAGLYVQHIVDKNKIENPIAIFALCLTFDIIATGIIYLLLLWISNGNEDASEIPLIKPDAF